MLGVFPERVTHIPQQSKNGSSVVVSWLEDPGVITEDSSIKPVHQLLPVGLLQHCHRPLPQQGRIDIESMIPTLKELTS
jgi:hypothetical protein